MDKQKIKFIATLGILSGIEIMLALTPLGYIPLGFTRATTIHIPVILGAVLLGPKAGMILGAVFGFSSIAINTFTPTITSYVFTPFYEGGNIFSLVIALVPRISIGIVAYYSFVFLKKISKNTKISLLITGALGSLTNTLLVMAGIYVFFGNEYAIAKETTFDALHYVIGSIILVNGIPEAIVASILTAMIGTVMLKYAKK